MMLKKLTLMACMMSLASQAAANIVILGTRAVYSADQKSLNIQLNNVGNRPSLVQSWLDSGDERSSPDSASSKVPFIITPPVTRVNANAGQTLRVVYTGEALPQDRESIFYLNVLDIPPKPTDAETGGQNYLQMSIRSRIKFFFRPKLAVSPSEAYKQVTWSISGDTITAHNPTPYYITFAEVEAFHSTRGGVKSGKIGMVAPFASLALPIKNAQHAQRVKWKVINDYGGYESGDTPLK